MTLTTIGVHYQKFSEKIASCISKHALLKEYITAKDNFDLYIDSDLKHSTFKCHVSRMADNVTVTFEGRADSIPETDDVLVIEEGHCHTGDAMRATEDIICPDDRIEGNFNAVKTAHRCGCIQCGHIFSGETVKDRITDFPGDDNGTAVCPFCGGLSVITEDDDAPVNENTLWRWFRHMYGPDSLNADSEDEALAMLGDIEDEDD